MSSPDRRPSRGGETRVFLENLPKDVRKDEIDKEFSIYGRIAKVYLIYDPPGSGFVEFFEPSDAEYAASSMDGAEFLGSKLKTQLTRGGVPRGRSSMRRPFPSRGRGFSGGGGGGGYGDREGGYSMGGRGGSRGGGDGGGWFRGSRGGGGGGFDRGRSRGGRRGGSFGNSRGGGGYGGGSRGGRGGYGRDFSDGGGYSRGGGRGFSRGGEGGSGRGYSGGYGGGEYRSSRYEDMGENGNGYNKYEKYPKYERFEKDYEKYDKDYSKYPSSSEKYSSYGGGGSRKESYPRSRSPLDFAEEGYRSTSPNFARNSSSYGGRRSPMDERY